MEKEHIVLILCDCSFASYLIEENYFYYHTDSIKQSNRKNKQARIEQQMRENQREIRLVKNLFYP